MTLANAYAHVLFDASKEEKGAQLSHFLDRFIAVLDKKGHDSLLPDILRAYAVLKQTETKAHTTTMVCARERDFKKYERELKKIAESGTRTEKTVDDTLIGGYVIRKGDTLYDNSYKKMLLQIFERATTMPAPEILRGKQVS